MRRAPEPRRGLLGPFAGFALAALPGLVATVGVPGLARSGVRRVLWKDPTTWLLLAGAVAWVAPSVLVDDASRYLDLGQMGLLLLLWAARPLLRDRLAGSPREALAWGILTGLAVIAVISVVQLATDRGRIAGWTDHPNLWAAQVIVPTLGLIVLSRTRGIAVFGIVLAGLTIAAAGSRGAVASLLIGLLLWRPLWRGRVGVYLAVLIALGTAVVVVARPRFVSGIPQIVAHVTRSESQPTNLLSGPTQALGVQVEPGGETDAFGETILRKTRPFSWARWQQPLILFPDVPYTISGEFSPTASSIPGLLGVGTGPDRTRHVGLILLQDGRWSFHAEGGLVTDLNASRTADGWHRFEWTVVNRSGAPIRWWVGPSPALVDGDVGAEIRVRGLQAELGRRATPYTPPTRLPLEAVQFLDRLRAFRVAIDGYRASPWVGHPDTAFSEYYRRNPPDQRTVVPLHAHNVWLATLFERGLLGVVGLVAFFVVALLAGGPSLLPALAAVIVSNVFDVTLWSAQQMNGLVLLSALLASPPDRIARNEGLPDRPPGQELTRA